MPTSNMVPVRAPTERPSRDVVQKNAVRRSSRKSGHVLNVWKTIVTWSKYRQADVELSLVSIIRSCAGSKSPYAFQSFRLFANDQCRLCTSGVSVKKSFGV